MPLSSARDILKAPKQERKWLDVIVLWLGLQIPGWPFPLRAICRVFAGPKINHFVRRARSSPKRPPEAPGGLRRPPQGGPLPRPAFPPNRPPELGLQRPKSENEPSGDPGRQNKSDNEAPGDPARNKKVIMKHPVTPPEKQK